jgi:ParB family chromosome partitioning protein
VIVRDYDDQELLEIAIIENVQRADLNAIDEGAAYRALMERFGHTQEQVASALGKSRSHVANQMRLLQLPADVQALVEEGRLTAGHARPLVGHPKPRSSPAASPRRPSRRGTRSGWPRRPNPKRERRRAGPRTGARPGAQAATATRRRWRGTSARRSAWRSASGTTRPRAAGA